MRCRAPVRLGVSFSICHGTTNPQGQKERGDCSSAGRARHSCAAPVLATSARSVPLNIDEFRASPTNAAHAQDIAGLVRGMPGGVTNPSRKITGWQGGATMSSEVSGVSNIGCRFICSVLDHFVAGWWRVKMVAFLSC